MAFNSDEVRRDRIKEILAEVESAHEDRGYQSVSQISGYLI
ncbi:IreB family regulatory phosphoprotein, partial [Erysipelothrix rhusiopathiae]|nr:IreB family regulatory phosphoprotein [Erysipelothrix rhusiopathiae]